MAVEVTQNLTQITISTAGVSGPIGLQGEAGESGTSGTSGTSGVSTLVDSDSYLTTSSFNEYSSSQADVNLLIVGNLNELYNGQELLNQFTSSYSIDSSSLATTGSNSFIGNQQITGSVYIEEGQLLQVGPGSVFASVEGFTYIQDTSGYIQLDASNSDGSQNYVSVYINANSDESLFNVYDNTPGRITARINLSTSGSFNISTSDNTATLLLNGVSYDAHLVSTSSLNNLISLFNTFTASAATTGSNDFVGDQSIDGILYLKDPGNELGDVAQIVNNNDALYISSQDDRKIVLSVYSGSVYDWEFGVDGHLTVPGNINGAGNLATTASFNEFTSSQEITNANVNDDINILYDTKLNTSSFNEFTSSQEITNENLNDDINILYDTKLNTSSFNDYTSSLATTGSNTFEGNQQVNGWIDATDYILTDTVLYTNAIEENTTNGGITFFAGGPGFAFNTNVEVTGSINLVDGDITLNGNSFSSSLFQSSSISGSVIEFTKGDDTIQQVKIPNGLGYSGLGWARYDDTTYTTASAFSIADGSDVKIPCNASSSIETHMHSLVPFFNPDAQIIQAENEGDVYVITFDFNMRAAVNPSDGDFVRLQMNNTVGTPYTRVGRDLYFSKNDTEWHSYHEIFQYYSDSDFVLNGNEFNIIPHGVGVEVSDVIVFIQRSQNHSQH